MIKLSILGASDTVTGSRYLLRANEQTFLIDCGLFQGDKTLRDKNWQQFAIDPATIDHVILTHAHLDHSGYLPKLCKEGYQGPIHCSQGTYELCHIMLPDAAHLEEEQASYANKTGYSHHKPATPLFTTKDAEKALGQLKSHLRHEWIQLSKNVSIRFLCAGHILGASLVQFNFTEPNGQWTMTFSGDLGHSRSLTMCPPEPLTETDLLILESTYGNRLHPREDPGDVISKMIQKIIATKGVLVIPAFAVGRAQEVLFIIRKLEDEGKIPSIPVILDSPMSVQATRIFLKNKEDKDFHSIFARSLKESSDEKQDDFSSAFLPKLFEATTSTDESMLTCMRDGPLVAISASGMLNGGRILHHLKHRLPDSRNVLLFTGYQAEGTKGRFLQDHLGKLDTLRIFHKEVPIEATIATCDSLSAHGDYQDILSWMSSMATLPKKVILSHGTKESQKAFAEKIASQFHLPVECAYENNEFTFS